MKRNTKVTKTTVHELEITAADLRQKFRLPDDAVITLDVPRGGFTYTGTKLPIDKDTPITARWVRL